jgi:nicotinamide phosphoribosyltransferase
MTTYYNSILFNTDSYKYSHWLQLPEKTTSLFSYIESRGGVFYESLFFGLQSYIKNYLMRPITMEEIDFVESIIRAHGEPFNKKGFQDIVTKHKGYFPVQIKAVLEGSLVPIKNALVTIENTDPEMPWVTNFLETSLLRSVWYGTTVATTSFMIKQLIKSYLDKTGTPEDIMFKLHDFGARGVSSRESAAMGGAAHLINFMGTDTVDGFIELMKNYGSKDVPAFSIPAAEHSTITIWGKENEAKAYQNMVDKFGGKGKMLAVVSDSYDIFNACKLWGTELKDQIISSGSCVVIRPDSGDPATVVLKVLEILEEHFGSVVNSKNYKVLNHVRVIQGDGINHDSIKDILNTITDKGFSADNVAFGMGGALLQHMNRDTMEFAMKCSYAVVDNKLRDVFKNPVTSSSKASKKGLLTLMKNANGEYVTVDVNSKEYLKYFTEGWEPALNRVWYVCGENRYFMEQNISDIRARANSYLS